MKLLKKNAKLKKINERVIRFRMFIVTSLMQIVQHKNMPKLKKNFKYSIFV